jgi:hypothetical protein
MAPTSVANVQRPRQPINVSSKSGTGRRIQHRELLASIIGKDTFTIGNTFELNPGIAATFPWLAAQAIYWEQYKFHKLKFEYVTRCSTSQAGSVIMAPDYDASDAAPTTEQNLSTYQDSVEDAPWKDITTVLNPSSMHPDGPKKFVRNTNFVYGDIKTFDVGKFFLATTDCGAGDPKIGKLWVEYDVELFVPQTSPSAPVAAQNTAMFARNNGQNWTTAVPAPIGWDAVIVDALHSNWVNPTTALIFPAGTYLIVFCGSFRDSANETFTASGSILKNGVAQLNMNGITVVTGVAIETAVVTFQGVITVNGTDTLGIQMTLTGAAGTLSLVGASAQLLIQPA